MKAPMTLVTPNPSKGKKLENPARAFSRAAL